MTDFKKPDCGDHSCLFAEKKTGMRTNGGCRCFDHAGFSKDVMKSAIQMLPELLYLRERVKRLEDQLDELEEEVYSSAHLTKVGRRTDI